MKVNSMVKNTIWGIFMFIINIFLLYQNYSKDFVFDTTFFLQVNQMMAFAVGIIYAQQYRRFNLKYVLGVISNSLVFSILFTILFFIYGIKVNFTFTLLVFIGVFLCMFFSYWFYYTLFCPDKYKRRYQNRKGNQRKNSI